MKHRNNNTLELKPTIAPHPWIAAACLVCATLDASANDAASLTGSVVPTAEGPRFELQWTGQTNAQHRVQSCDDLGDGAGWRTEDLVVSDAWPVRWKPPGIMASHRFYRLAGPEAEIHSVEPAIAPPNAPVTLYVAGQCFQSNDTFRVGGAAIPGGAIISSALGRVEVPPQPPGVVRVELVRDTQVLSFFDVFFFDPGSDPFYSLQGPPTLPPGAPVSAHKHRGHVTVLKSHEDGHVTVLKGRHRGHVTVLKSHDEGCDDDCDGYMAISPSTGEVLQQETDLAIPGRGLDFIWTRTYRSRTGADSPMGHGWTHAYDVYLTSEGEDFAVHDGTGRRDVFRRQPNDTFTCSGVFREGRWDEVTGNFVLEFADTGRWEFYHFNVRPAGGKLARCVDRNGNIMRFEYDGAGRLTRVIDTLDRTNTVAYNAGGRIGSVTDFSGRTVAYEYVTTDADTNGTPGDLVAVISPAVTGTPNGNDFPSGKTNRYTYARGFTSQHLHHNLISRVDGLGQAQFELGYAATTNAGDFDFDTVVSIQHGAARKDFWLAPLTPAPSNDFATVRCVINDYVGNVTEEFHDARHRLLRRLEFTGRANPAIPTTDTANRPVNPLRPDDPPFFETRWEWNNDSLCTAWQRPLTNRVEWVYQGDLEPATPARHRGNLRAVHFLSQDSELGGEGWSDMGGLLMRHDPRFGTAERADYTAQFMNGRYVLRAGVPLGVSASSGERRSTGVLALACTAGSENPVLSSFPTFVVNPRGQETLCAYDAAGNVIHTQATERKSGSVVACDYNYNAHGQLTAITNAADAAGRRRVDTFTYHSSGSQQGYLHQAVVDAGPVGRNLTTSYEYDARGNVVRVTDPRGTPTEFTLNALNQTVAKQTQGATFGERVRSEFWYDAADQLVRAERGNLEASGSFDPNGGAIAFAYDPFHRPIRTVNVSPDGLLTLTNEFSYDGNSQLALHRSPPAVHGLDSFAVTQTTYDERGLLFGETHAPGSPQALTLQHDYDGNGNRTRVSKIDAIVWKAKLYSYDGLDRLVRVTDPMGNETRYEYDLNDNLKRAVHYGETNDVPGSAGNRRLAETRYEYDSLDRLVHRVDSFFDVFTQTPLGDGGRDATFDYAPNGLILRQTNDHGVNTDYAYDSAGRLLRVTDARTNRVEYSYDANGNLLSATETGRSDLGGPDEVFVRNYKYDALNRRVADWDNVGNTNGYAYDSRGNLVRHTDPRGNDVCYDYDGLNRKGGDISYIGPCAAGDAVRTNRLFYQTTRLTSSTDGNGNITTYAYDSLDRRVRITLADNTSVTNVYDGHGNLVWTRDANGTEIFSSYDALDRCARRNIIPGPGVAPDTTQETFTYDGLSRLVRAQNNASEVTFAYDSLGHLVRESAASGTPLFNPREYNLRFDAHGLPLALTNPSGRIVEYLYDELDRVTRLRTRAFAGAQPQLLGTFAYAGPDRLVRVTRPNGIQTDYTHGGRSGVPNPPDDFGWGEIQRVRHAVGGATPVIDERVFAHDRNQNKLLRALTVPFAPGAQTNRQTFQYDALDRLVQSATTRDGLPAQDATYVLDPNGNRQVVIGGGTAQPYLMDNTLPQPADFQVNQYTVTPFDAREYDGNGNLRATLSGDPRAPDVRAFVYDYAGRPVLVLNDDRSVAFYAYDALGQRFARVLYAGVPPVPVQTNRYLYAGGQVIEEEDGGGAVARSYILDGTRSIDDGEIRTFRWTQVGGPFAFSTQTGALLFYHHDDQGSAVALTDAAGNVVERYDYDDYGLPRFLDAEGNPLVDAGGLPLNASPSGNPYLYHGMPWDEETRLYHAGGSPLDPATGQHTGRTKIDNTPPRTSVSFTVRAYAGNNPWSLKQDEGGRHTPFHNQYRPQSGLRTSDVTGEIYLAEGREMRSSTSGGDTTVHPWSAVVFRNRSDDLTDLLPWGWGRMVFGSHGGGDTELLPWGAGIFRFQGSGADADLLPWGAGIFRSGGDTTIHPWGASAYATGSSVAFGSGPDLHTVAHEAAHVVQQSPGVNSVLKTKHDTAKNSINNMR